MPRSLPVQLTELINKGQSCAPVTRRLGMMLQDLAFGEAPQGLVFFLYFDTDG